MKQAVIGIIFSENKEKVLLIKRRDVPIWVLPGGGLEAGETPEEAVLREVREETGIEAEIQRKVAEYTPVSKLAGFTHVFECFVKNGELSTGPETLDIAFWPLARLPDSLFIVHQDWLNDALKNDPQLILATIDRVTAKGLAKYFIQHPIQVIRFLFSRMGFPINNSQS